MFGQAMSFLQQVSGPRKEFGIIGIDISIGKPLWAGE
jgi:hypothetical protein